jgi:hypothetical protein
VKYGDRVQIPYSIHITFDRKRNGVNVMDRIDKVVSRHLNIFNEKTALEMK